MPDDLVPTFTPTPTPTAHSSSTTPKLALSKAESPLHPLSTASGERSHDHSSASTAPLAFSVDNLVGNSATSSPPLSSSPHSQSPRLAKALPLATSPTAFDEGKLSRTHLQPHNASIPHYRAASPPDSVVPAVPRSVAAASSGKAACVLPPSAAAAGELAVRPKVAAGTATDSPTTSDDRAVGIETFYGYIGSAMDAVVVVEACRLGILHSLDMRPREVSEISTRSGSVIVFDEAGSRMRRWRPSPPTPVECIPGLDPVFGVGVLRGNCSILDDGLIKKTISVVMDDGRRFRVISYYLRSDVVEGRLSLPTKSPILASIDPSSERLLKLLPSETRSPKGSANGSGAASQSTGGVKRKPLSQPPTAVATKRSRADSPPSPHTPSDSGVSMPAGGNGKVNPEAGSPSTAVAFTRLAPPQLSSSSSVPASGSPQSAPLSGVISLSTGPFPGSPVRHFQPIWHAAPHPQILPHGGGSGPVTLAVFAPPPPPMAFPAAIPYHYVQHPHGHYVHHPHPSTGQEPQHHRFVAGNPYGSWAVPHMPQGQWGSPSNGSTASGAHAGADAAAPPRSSGPAPSGSTATKPRYTALPAKNS
ncbi:hypothetical protein DFJ73DRAFT_780231 [Zopfochytrium polystomum]|nr:hypothetical protein DFJ73DRAFT_780231 [Zopfochytrium polystomum]